MTSTTNHTTTSSGCPAWCPQSEAGHRWEPVSGFHDLERVHKVEVGTIDLVDGGEQRVTIEVMETLEPESGIHTVSPLAVSLEPLGLHLSPAEASMFASLIEDAATRGFALLGARPADDEDGQR